MACLVVHRCLVVSGGHYRELEMPKTYKILILRYKNFYSWFVIVSLCQKRIDYTGRVNSTPANFFFPSFIGKRSQDLASDANSARYLPSGCTECAVEQAAVGLCGTTKRCAHGTQLAEAQTLFKVAATADWANRRLRMSWFDHPRFFAAAAFLASGFCLFLRLSVRLRQPLDAAHSNSSLFPFHPNTPNPTGFHRQTSL